MAHHILIIGGGIGGTMTANHLVIKLYPELLSGKVRITMLSILLGTITSQPLCMWLSMHSSGMN
jgi:NADH dehydrogenase FAD-containing subunit